METLMAFSRWHKKQFFQLQIGTYQLQIAPEQTLLQAAKANGVDMPQGCTVGCCGLGRCQLLSGQIDAPSAAE
jgi:ferredoxin